MSEDLKSCRYEPIALSNETVNTTRKSTPSPEGQQQLETLRQAVIKTLEKKRRLGQYAVIWRDGKPIRTDEETPEQTASPTNTTA